MSATEETGHHTTTRCAVFQEQRDFCLIDSAYAVDRNRYSAADTAKKVRTASGKIRLAAGFEDISGKAVACAEHICEPGLCFGMYRGSDSVEVL